VDSSFADAIKPAFGLPVKENKAKGSQNLKGKVKSQA
jgi:hypothetical protein